MKGTSKYAIETVTKRQHQNATVLLRPFKLRYGAFDHGPINVKFHFFLTERFLTVFALFNVNLCWVLRYFSSLLLFFLCIICFFFCYFHISFDSFNLASG